MSRPPPGRGRARSTALWALAMAWTMASPSPCPPVWPDPLAAKLLEWLEQAASRSGGISVPVLLTDITARPAVLRRRDLDPAAAGTLCRSALSSRFATRLSASLGSPVAGAAASAASTGCRGARLPARRSVMTWPATSARSNGSHRSTPPLAAGQREQRRDQALLLIAQVQHLLAGGPQRAARWRPGRRARPAAGSAPRPAGCAARARRWPRNAAATRTTPPAARTGRRASRRARRTLVGAAQVEPLGAGCWPRCPGRSR